jgi:acetyl/propionyl-CoA carboxylase alpha subunit
MGFDYDALIAKLCCVGADAGAGGRAHAARLDEYDVRGLTTNLDFQRRSACASRISCRARYDTGFIERHRDVLLAPEPAALVEPDEAMAGRRALGHGAGVGRDSILPRGRERTRPLLPLLPGPRPRAGGAWAIETS